MTKRRELLELTIGVVIIAGAYVAIRFLVDPAIVSAFFARPTHSAPSGGGVWSNLVASVVCVASAWWRLRVQSLTQHAESLALATRHHKEQLEQAAAQHKEHLAEARKNHDATERRLDDHATLIAAAARPPEPVHEVTVHVPDTAAAAEKVVEAVAANRRRNTRAGGSA